MKYLWIVILFIILWIPLPSMKEEVQKVNKDLFSVQNLTPSILKRVKEYSCKEDICTKNVEELRYISILYIDFNGNEKKGEIVADYRIADDLKEIFEELYKAKYPLERVELIDVYEGNDDLSMQNNNTSAFNFRYIAGTNKLSRHAEGLAIDINPLYNPQVTANAVYPEEGRPYIDRQNKRAHMIDKEDLAYKLFIEHGFTWGGNWSSSKDYQHFEKEM